MQDLILQEQFEIEVLDRLKSGRFLDRLAFGGGTMLRLCHGLGRYSVDLDFWFSEKDWDGAWFAGLQTYLARYYEMRDAAEKFYTFVIELKSPEYPRSLKLEMRKQIMATTEMAIAYSRFVPTQVYVRTMPLLAVMESKIAAFLQRKEIRDAYDLEFLVKKGLRMELTREQSDLLMETINGLSRQDYQVKLSSLLEPEQREHYRQNNFSILKEQVMGSGLEF